MPGSLRATIGDVDATVQGRPGHITRYEHAILQQLADLAARDYQRLPSKIAARTPIQQYVSDEVMKMLGTLSHNVEEKAQDQRRQKAQDQRRQAAEQRQIYEIINQNERLGAQQREAPAPQVAADRNEEQIQRIGETDPNRPLTLAEIRAELQRYYDKEFNAAQQKEAEKNIRREEQQQRRADASAARVALRKRYRINPNRPLTPAEIHAELKRYPDIYDGGNIARNELRDRISRGKTTRLVTEEEKLVLSPPNSPDVSPPSSPLRRRVTLAEQEPIVRHPMDVGINEAERLVPAMDASPPSSPLRRRVTLAEQEPIVRHPMDVGINEEERFPNIEPGFETLRHESFDPMVDEALRDNFSLGQQEIKASFSSRNKHLRDMILAKTLDVGKSPLRDAHEIGSFLSDKYRGMSSSVLDEMTENYLSNILPKANLGYMGGSWNSPQRRTHNEKVLSNLHKDVSRNLINLEAKTAEKGLEEAGQQRTRQLYAAKGAAEMLNQQQQEASRGAETLANLEKTKIGSDLAKIEAARTLGAEEQNFEGSRLEEMQREALRQQEYPLEMIERQLGASRGIPTASYATHQQISQQPNYAAIGAGGIGNMAAAMMYPQQLQQRKSGGLIQKYAPGGFVLPKVENDPQTQLIEQEAQSLMNEPYNPQQALLHGIAKAGDKIAERYTGMPGIAGDMADTHLAHQEAHAVKRARGLNLIQQVQASRVKQQNFLAELEYKNKHHSETLGETSRHNKAMESLQESRGGSGSNGPGGGSITDRKAAREAVAALRRSKSMKRELSILSELSSKIKTGPVRGLLNSGYLKGEDANKMEVGANKLILDMHQGMKNIPRSEEFMKRIESTKPNVNNYPEANKMALKMMAEGVDDIEQNSIDTLLAAGYTMEDIQNIRQDHEESPETEVSDGMINVISPEGIPGKLPAHNLEKALARGYKRAA